MINGDLELKAEDMENAQHQFKINTNQREQRARINREKSGK